MEDQKIIALYLDRDEAAIAETDRKYGSYCHRIAMNILAELSDAEECVNDTYLHTWNAIPPTIPQRLQAFLGKITRNLSINRYHANAAQKRRASQYAVTFEELSGVLASSKTQEDQIDSMVLKELLDRFLAELPPENRWIFVGRYWYFDSVKEIALKLGMSESNVKIRLHRARNALGALLRKEGLL